MSQFNLALLAESTKQTEPILEVVGFLLVFASFFLTIFFIYQVIYDSVRLGKMIFGSAQRSNAGKIIASPMVSIPIALVVGGIVLYLLTAYEVINLSGTIYKIAAWFQSIFTKQ